jgi:hypothetical protein
LFPIGKSATLAAQANVRFGGEAYLKLWQVCAEPFS